MNKKGMTMTMQLLITAIVLVVTALVVLLIVNSKLISGPEQVQQSGNRDLCVAARTSYCNAHGNGCWNASKAVMQDTSCSKVLGRSAKESLYNCEASKYYNETQYNDVVAGTLAVTCGAEEY